VEQRSEAERDTHSCVGLRVYEWACCKHERKEDLPNLK